MNHYSDPTISFAAQYGPDGQRIVDQGRPSTASTCCRSPIARPQALDETIAHLGNYLFHELTTPLGIRLDHVRFETLPGVNRAACSGSAQASTLRSFGTYAVWFPRGLLLHVAARQACRRLIEQWIATGPNSIPDSVQPEIQNTFQKITTNPSHSPEEILGRIEKTAPTNSVTRSRLDPGRRFDGTIDEARRANSGTGRPG